jgi:hypothetical protein
MNEDLKIPDWFPSLFPSNFPHGIRVKEIGGIFGGGGSAGTAVNIIPSDYHDVCAPYLAVICLKGSRYSRGSGHIDFRTGVERLVQHMQGLPCRKITQ